ncbi:hypothetical protein LV83_03505 [Algoriphagus yeomjeoni]|uniref:DUF4221 domain-containing protein n=2 Tax=Algoriphagus yeomjeoni TaxID=291403 RepID=A0A327P087_9BACT|nr:hypothetical protein LV83_03505 [Algoriphagus yeomjeoni]
MVSVFLFFCCKSPSDESFGKYHLQVKELEFPLPTTAFYPTSSLVFNNQFFFLDAKGQQILVYDDSFRLVNIWQIKDHFVDLNERFNQIYKYGEDHFLLYSSMENKGIVGDQSFSDIKLVDFSSHSEQLLFPNGSDLQLIEKELVLPALDYERGKRLLKIVSIDLNSGKRKNLFEFNEPLLSKIPIMFYTPSIILQDNLLEVYFPTLDKGEIINIDENQNEKIEILDKYFGENFDLDKFNSDPFYLFDLSFYYYSLKKNSTLIRLRNEKFNFDKNKPIINYILNRDNRSVNFKIPLPDSLFHKTVAENKGHYYFINSDLTNKKEGIVYLSEFSFELK